MFVYLVSGVCVCMRYVHVCMVCVCDVWCVCVCDMCDMCSIWDVLYVVHVSLCLCVYLQKSEDNS